jgi:hypothetical protein
MFPF